VSTFVHSAQKVSGTTERTDNGKGRGVGTRGYQLTKDKRGNPKFDLFWVYTFVDDYALPNPKRRALVDKEEEKEEEGAGRIRNIEKRARGRKKEGEFTLDSFKDVTLLQWV
jgi:hypothetical protein